MTVILPSTFVDSYIAPCFKEGRFPPLGYLTIFLFGIAKIRYYSCITQAIFQLGNEHR